MKKPLVVLAGPTATGKTATAISLAKKIGGEIISADSMQVYRYMDIGTAKPSQEEMEGVPHYLIDAFDPDEVFDVTIFQKKAKEAMDAIIAKGKIPILVGGTGFYINALVRDTDFTAEDNDYNYRQELYQLAEEQGPELLYQRLCQVDEEYAKTLHANNVKKVVRALEYYRLTGMPFSAHNAEQKEKLSPYNTAIFVLNMERQTLYDRINLRVDNMVQAGLVEEVKGLLDRGYSPDLVSMQGLGYKEFVPYFHGECSLDMALEEIKKGSRHFAKRQLTWFHRQTEGIWLAMDRLSKEEVLDTIVQELQEKGIVGVHYD